MTDPNYKFEYKYPKDLVMRSFPILGKGDDEKISAAIELFRAAKKPVIYSGGGTIQADASKELTEFSKLIGCPVTNTLMGLGAFPGNDNQFVGMLGMHGTYEANMVMSEADLIFNVGARFDDRITNNPSKFGLAAKKIHIDSDPSSIDKIIGVDLAIEGDAKLVMQQLIEQVKASGFDQTIYKDWWSKVEDWRKAHGLNHDLSLIHI